MTVIGYIFQVEHDPNIPNQKSQQTDLQSYATQLGVAVVVKSNRTTMLVLYTRSPIGSTQLAVRRLRVRRSQKNRKEQWGFCTCMTVNGPCCMYHTNCTK